MRNNSRRFIVLLVCAVLVAVAWLVLRPPREPVYDGKPLSYWLRHPMRTPLTNPPGLQGTMITFPQVHSNGVPFLIRALERPDGTFDKRYWNLWLKLTPRLRGYLPKPLYPGELRIHAAIILTKLVTNAQPAIPALIRVMKSDASENARFSAATCLLAVGGDDPRVRAAFNEVLEDPSQPQGVRMIASGIFRSTRSKPVESAGLTNTFDVLFPDFPLFRAAEISESNQ